MWYAPQLNFYSEDPLELFSVGHLLFAGCDGQFLFTYSLRCTGFSALHWSWWASSPNGGFWVLCSPTTVLMTGPVDCLLAIGWVLYELGAPIAYSPQTISGRTYISSTWLPICKSFAAIFSLPWAPSSFSSSPEPSPQGEFPGAPLLRVSLHWESPPPLRRRLFPPGCVAATGAVPDF